MRMIDNIINELDLDEDCKIIVSEKLGDITYSIKKPIYRYKDRMPKSEESYLVQSLKILEGYPHFTVAYKTICEEINVFFNPIIEEDCMVIRFGDLHTDKPDPVVGQFRNLILGSSLKNLASLMGKKAKLIFGIGDLGIRTKRQIYEIIKNQLDTNNENAFLQRGDIYEAYKDVLNQIRTECIDKINFWLDLLKIEVDEYIFDSSICKTWKYFLEIYQMENVEKYISRRGEINYLLQEVLWIFELKRKWKCRNVFFILGKDQKDHVFETKQLLKELNFDNGIKYIEYGTTKNSDIRGKENWGHWKSYIEVALEGCLDMNEVDIEKIAIEVFKICILFNATSTTLDILKIDISAFKKWMTIKGLIDAGFSGQSQQEGEWEDLVYFMKFRAYRLLMYKLGLINYVGSYACKNGNLFQFTEYLYDLARAYIKFEKEVSESRDIKTELVRQVKRNVGKILSKCIKGLGIDIALLELKSINQIV